MKIEIIENNVVTIYSDELADFPFAIQETFPDGTPFESEEQAFEWAEKLVAYVTSETAPFVPDGPGKAGEPRTKFIDEVLHVFDADLEEWVPLSPTEGTSEITAEIAE